MNDRTNTIFGWILFSGIVALGLSSLSGKIFHADNPERLEQLGYVIEGVIEEDAADAGPSLAMMMAQTTPSAGETVFAKCSACHSIEQGGPNGIGPNLWAVMGAPIGSHVPGYDYSAALVEKGGSWTFEAMDEWLKSPRAFANGTKMSFAGLSNIEERAAVIVYMNAMGSNLPLPAAVEEANADAEAAAAGGAAAPAEGGASGEGAAPTAGAEAAPAG